MAKIVLLSVFIAITLNSWGFTPQEKEMRAREAHSVIMSEEYLEWREYTVGKVFPSNRQSSNFPTPKSFSGEVDCTYTQEFPIVLGREVRSNVYKILTVNEEDTGHLIIVNYGANLTGEPAILRFYSGSVEKPSIGYENYPRYYTTQFYRLYVP